jgi:hypothetical protein
MRRELEAAWQRRVSHAQARYQEKAAIVRLLMTERLALPKNEGFDPDGAFALHQALRRESKARREYTRVLTIFSERILTTVPDGSGLLIAADDPRPGTSSAFPGVHRGTLLNHVGRRQ